MEMRTSRKNRKSSPETSPKANVSRGKTHSPKKAILTRREREVLACLAEGKMYKEISDYLSVTLDTVRFHSKRIYKKLGVRSRTEAVLWFLREANLEKSKTTQRCR
jgi:DNA-binding NarL/FixJ family response regulator